jgi:hypothetical protein
MVDTQSLLALIDRMMAEPIMSAQRAAELWEANRLHRLAAVERMLDTGETYGVASGGPAFLNQPEDPFFKHLRSIDNDLAEHVKIVSDAFTVYQKTSEPPAPHYSMRIAIILSKAKMKDLEKAFLTAWCRHFGKIERRAGVTYDELAKRGAKLGVVL